MVFSNGKMDAYIKDNSGTIIWKVKVNTAGLMAEDTRENGRIIKCMEEVNSLG